MINIYCSQNKLIFLMLKKYFTIPESIPSHSPEHSKYEYIYGFALLFEVVMLYFTFHNLFVSKMYTLAIFNTVAFFILVGILMDLKRRRNILHTSYAVVFLIFFLILTFDIFSVKENYSFLWNFFLPVTAYYLLGSKKGTLVTLLFYCFFFYYAVSVINIDITQQSIVNIIMSYLILAAVLYRYESSREKSYRTLDKLFNSEKDLSAKLKELSITDKLTNIYNRVKLDEYLTMIHQRAIRYGEYFSIIIVDIDHFKEVNDTYGHLAGDEILIQFTKCIKNNIRTSDILGRWGGEEFMLILPNTNCNEAHTLAEQLRDSIEKCKFEYKFSNTACFGIATFTDEENEAKLISMADKALYEAKDSGRNCVKSKLNLS